MSGMRKIRPYNGAVKSPSEMTSIQLERYVAWGEKYLEWCLDDDGRTNSYDRMINVMNPYVLEIQNRERMKLRKEEKCKMTKS